MKKSFKFKQFSIEQQDCGMPVSTDGVLLGAWVKPGEKDKVLDIGTGTGLLTLMLAQRFSKIEITALDIDKSAIDTAKYNITNSPWHQRIHVEHQDITKWQSLQTFNTIICNPPYFTSGQSAQNQARAIARHTEQLPFSALIAAVFARLEEMGSAHFILPTLAATDFIIKAAEKGLSCTRLLSVKTTPEKPISRLLFSLQKTNHYYLDNLEQAFKSELEPFFSHSTKAFSKKPFNTAKALKAPFLDAKTLCIEQNKQYSRDFVNLTKDFYLKM